MQAVVAFERADPIPGGGALGELRAVQPAVPLHAGAFGRLRLTGVLNLEGATIPDGELAPGDWGEGFVDPRAQMHSPEHRPGAGTDQHKWSVAARWARPVHGHPVYGLVEWAPTSEAAGFFVFRSLLAEGAWSAGRHRLQYRFERTERPEEERVSAFRSLRPHLENAILGITRWTTHTAGYEVAVLRRPGLDVRPLVEVGYARIAKVGGGLFDVAGLYGRNHVWSLALGVRITGGAPMHRMGRYGAGEEAGAMAAMHDHEEVTP